MGLRQNILKTISTQIKNFDLFLEEKKSKIYKFKNNKVFSCETKIKKGIGLRVIEKDKIGFVSATLPDNVESLIENAIKNAEYGEKAYFDFPESFLPSQKPLNLFSSELIDLPGEGILETENEIVKELKNLKKGIKIDVTVKLISASKEIINSKGLNFKEEKTAGEIWVTLFSGEEGNIIELYETASSVDLSFTSIINHRIEKLKKLFYFSENEVKIKSGFYPVYFSPKSASMLLNFLLLSFNGKNVEKKISIFSNKVNEKFFNSYLTIIDDPFIEKRPFSRLIDDEGVKPEKIFLIKDGVIKNFVFDLQTAGKLNKSGNGHAYRSYTALPVPGFSNIILNINNNLKESEEKIFSSIDTGIYVDQLLGAGQSNLLAGEFNANTDIAYLIKDGKIKGRIKNCMLTDNLFEMFNKIKKVSDKSEIYGNIETPGILFENLKVNTE